MVLEVSITNGFNGCMPVLLPGCDGTVSDTEYSNTDIFTSYVKEHFLKYVQSRDSSQPVLLLYDGPCSHISHKSYFFRIFPSSSKYFLIHAGEADFARSSDKLEGFTACSSGHLPSCYSRAFSNRHRIRMWECSRF
jgi:hypothetical protein